MFSGRTRPRSRDDVMPPELGKGNPTYLGKAEA
jgi:hypothetical protein